MLDCKPHFVVASWTDHLIDRRGFRERSQCVEVSIPDDARVTVEEMATLLDNLIGNTALLGKRLKFQTAVGSPLRFSGDDVLLLMHPQIADFFHLPPIPGANAHYNYNNTFYTMFAFPPVRPEQEWHLWREAARSFHLEQPRIPKYVRVVMPDGRTTVQSSDNCAQTLIVIPWGETSAVDGGGSDTFFYEVLRKEYV